LAAASRYLRYSIELELYVYNKQTEREREREREIINDNKYTLNTDRCEHTKRRNNCGRGEF